MSSIDITKLDKEYAALKLIEKLYIDGLIPGFMFQNILDEYKDKVDVLDFNCSEYRGKYKCTE